MGYDESVLEELPPEKLLDSTAPSVIKPAIRMMGQVETIELYLDYEREHEDRPGIVRYISNRISELQDQDGNSGHDDPRNPETDSLAMRSRLGDPAGTDLDETLLKSIHAIGSDKSLSQVAPPEWDQC